MPRLIWEILLIISSYMRFGGRCLVWQISAVAFIISSWSPVSAENCDDENLGKAEDDG